MSHSMTDAEVKQEMARKAPPVSDDWKPNHKRHKKSYGLLVFQEATHWRTGKQILYELLSWHATERARNDAVANANRPRRWLPVVAMMKVDR